MSTLFATSQLKTLKTLITSTAALPASWTASSSARTVLPPFRSTLKRVKRTTDMPLASFIAVPLLPPVRRRAPAHAARRPPTACEAQPPNDPTSLRTESQIRRNQPPKPMRRRRRRRTVDETIDWETMSSVPLVRPDAATPESGEDYWMDLNDSVNLSDATTAPNPRNPKPEIDDKLKERLKKEVVNPYKQNWILRVTLLVAALILLVAIFGGEEQVPIIRIPDL